MENVHSSSTPSSRKDSSCTNQQESHMSHGNSEDKCGTADSNEKCSDAPPSYEDVVSNEISPAQKGDIVLTQSSSNDPSKTPLRRTSSTSCTEKPSLPKINCEEKIILCLDNSKSMFENVFQESLTSVQEASVLQVATTALIKFLLTKCYMDKRHQYSLLLMDEEDVKLIADLNSDAGNLLYMLQDIANNSYKELDNSQHAEDEQNFDMSKLFKQISQLVTPPSFSKGKKPPFIVRVIFLFGRSNCNLEFAGILKNYRKLVENPFFFFDAVYIHDIPSTTNLVTKTYTSLCELDFRDASLVQEVGIDQPVSSLYNAFTRLLAHPLQRTDVMGHGPLDIDDCF